MDENALNLQRIKLPNNSLNTSKHAAVFPPEGCCAAGCEGGRATKRARYHELQAFPGNIRTEGASTLFTFQLHLKPLIGHIYIHTIAGSWMLMIRINTLFQTSAATREARQRNMASNNCHLKTRRGSNTLPPHPANVCTGRIVLMEWKLSRFRRPSIFCQQKRKRKNP